MSTQIAVKIPEEILARLDEMVALGLFQNRSAAVRQALETLLVAHKRRAVDRAFRDAFQYNPETDDEMKETRRLAIEAIHDEVWEKWW